MANKNNLSIMTCDKVTTMCNRANLDLDYFTVVEIRGRPFNLLLLRYTWYMIPSPVTIPGPMTVTSFPIDAISVNFMTRLMTSPSNQGPSRLAVRTC